MERRAFIKACAATCALAAPDAFAASDLKPRFYSRVQLMNDRGQPLRTAELATGRNYIFHYPFEATPCFLLNLGKPTVRDVELKTETGSPYRWPGGVGPNRSIVGFSAICAHRLSYPTPQISFISYRDRSTSPAAAHSNVIHCCSEHSEYDPAAGAKVVGGPAPQPLSAILLEHDAKSDGLQAVGTLGGEMFDAFFSKFEYRLALERGGNGVRRQASGPAVVKELERYCKQQVRC
ncbi:MAG TPA: twin-arginine translocation signal domain-containing protein [Burkholderiales bacterium]|nr:twin-arginine translocation signal domain-containing protein [Burkholderiales bacterium]